MVNAESNVHHHGVVPRPTALRLRLETSPPNPPKHPQQFDHNAGSKSHLLQSIARTSCIYPFSFTSELQAQLGVGLGLTLQTNSSLPFPLLFVFRSPTIASKAFSRQ
jgi:hypothetical protein